MSSQSAVQTGLEAGSSPLRGTCQYNPLKYHTGPPPAPHLGSGGPAELLGAEGDLEAGAQRPQHPLRITLRTDAHSLEETF
jgi:hypothetical protein